MMNELLWSGGTAAGIAILGRLGNSIVAELNKALKEDATRDLKSKGSLKMGKAYVEKYTDGENFMYTLVFKKCKTSRCFNISCILYKKRNS